MSHIALLIHGCIENGNGDICATINIAQILSKHFQIPLAIYFTGSPSVLIRLTDFHSSLPILKTYQDVIDFKPTHIVSFHAHSSIDLIAKLPRINFEEYQYIPHEPNSYGLGLNVKGFITDPIHHGLGIFQMDIAKDELCAISLPTKGPYYFCYTNHCDKYKYHRIFAATVVTNLRPHGDVGLIFPGQFSIKLFAKQKLLNWLSDQDFREIRYGNMMMPILSSGTRILTLITGQFSHNEFLYLMSISEPEVICTGDQSVGEALMMGKKIYYQTHGHKSLFSRALAELINDIADIEINFCYNRVTKWIGDFSYRVALMSEHFSKLTNWDRVLKQIRQHHNCQDRIVEITRQFLQDS